VPAGRHQAEVPTPAPPGAAAPGRRSGVPRQAFALVAWARERVVLYRAMYAGLPPVTSAGTFRALPLLSPERLRAVPLAHQVDTLDDTQRTFTPFLPATILPARPIVADRDDTDDLYDEARAAAVLAGVRPGETLVLVAAPEQRYFAAELAERLGYYGVAAHVVVAAGATTVTRLLDRLAPAHLLTVGRTPDLDRPVITVREPAAPGPDLYVVPEVGIVAVRPPGGAAHVLLRDRYHVESAPGGRLILTALRRFHQPLIRYLLPDRGRVAGSLLRLEEVMP
jgi:hypothetical protein